MKFSVLDMVVQHIISSPVVLILHVYIYIYIYIYIYVY